MLRLTIGQHSSRQDRRRSSFKKKEKQQFTEGKICFGIFERIDPHLAGRAKFNC